MTVRVGFASDKGRIRENNEDSLLVLDLTWMAEGEHEHIGLYAVSDGIGGEAAGEVASRLTVTAIAREVVEHLVLDSLSNCGNPARRAAEDAASESRPLGNPLHTLHKAVESANGAVRRWVEEHPESFGMGATITAAFLLDHRAIIGHVGDSRCYLLDAGTMEQITDDHTLAGQMQREGNLTGIDVSRHPLRNVLYRSVGSDDEFPVDMIERNLPSGRRLLLCSDGLTGVMTDDEIARVVRAFEQPQDAVDELIKCANRAGGYDNITAVLIAS